MVDAPVEDETDPVGPAGVEVVADDLLEEDPSGDWSVEHLGQGELGLQDGEVVGVAGRGVLLGERVGQPTQPLAQQRVDVLWAEGVADGLQRGQVVDRGEAIVQRGEIDAGLGGLALGPVVAIQAQPGIIGEIRAELEEERAEVGVDAVEVEVVDQRGGPHQPRVGRPGDRVVPPLGAPHRGLLLPATDEEHPLGAGKRGQVARGDVVLALPRREMHQIKVVGFHEMVHIGHEPLGHRVHQRCGRILVAAVADEEPGHTPAVLQPPLEDVEVHPVDAFHLEDHMLGQHLSYGTG